MGVEHLGSLDTPKKTKLDMLASQVCMLEVGSIYMSLVLMLHNFCGGLLAGEMYSQHMV